MYAFESLGVALASTASMFQTCLGQLTRDIRFQPCVMFNSLLMPMQASLATQVLKLKFNILQNS